MRQMEIEKVLKDLYESNINLKQYGTKLTEKMIYHYLTKLGLPEKERNERINNNFPDWIETFKNFPNIEVFNSRDWKYFCQFINGHVEPECIKMYVSLDSSHINKGAKIIFSFLANNNISHLSKIGSDVRTDDIVIRLTNEDDARKLSDFISNSKYIQDGMQKVNPFCFEHNGIGYAYDGHLSYNSCVSKIIADYINRMYELGKDKNEININSFYQFVDAYSQIPEKQNELPFVNGDYEKITEASLVLELLKISLTSNNINDFFKFYNYTVNNKMQNKYRANSEDKEELFKEAILTTMKKYSRGFDKNYPERSGYDFLNAFLDGNIDGITRDNNLRNRIRENLSLEDTLLIAKKSEIPGKSNRDIVMNYVKTVMLNEIVKCSEEKFPGYGIAQLQEYLITGQLKYITESLGNARTIAKNLNPTEIYNLFAELGVSDIYQYIDYFYKNNNKVK